MSRLGKRRLTLSTGVSVQLKQDERFVQVKGPKGSLHWTYPKGISIELQVADGGAGVVYVKQDSAQSQTTPMLSRSRAGEKALWGLAWSRMRWMIEGVSAGFTKQLEVQGVGYRVKVEGGRVILNIGKSYPVSYTLPEGITATADPKQTYLTVAGADKELVGLAASQLRAFKPPEPYKGKGIRYVHEVIIKKAGKTAATGGATKATK